MKIFRFPSFQCNQTIELYERTCYNAAMRTPYHPSRDDITLPEVLYALSDPIRLGIIKKLATTEEESCGTFYKDLAKSTVSHHFKVLREAGITRTRPEGTYSFLS